MKEQRIIVLVAIAVVSLAIGVAFWLQKKSPVISERPSKVTDKLSAVAQPATNSSAVPRPLHPFDKMGVLERNNILDEIMKRDFFSIFQSWLDAGRVEHDLMKQFTIADHLGGVLRQRTPSQEFLNQIRGFIANKSNSELERGMLLAALQFAATKQTEELLIEIATSASDDVMRSAMGSISTLGTNFGGENQEELAPALERLWRESHDQILIRSVVMAMAQVGASSSMELLLTAALAPNGRDDLRKNAARGALESANILNDNAVPPLAARLSNEAPESEASKLSSSTLARMTSRAAAKALVAWLQNANASAATVAREYATHTQFPEIWQTALNPSVPFRSEENREAIRKGLAAYHAGRVMQP